MSALTVRLNHRGIIRIGGADRRAFLQGLVSNDINLCTPDNPIYAALLTPQGKFLHDMFIVDAGDDFLIDCEAARADDLIKRLSAFKLRAKVTFENCAGQFEVWASWHKDRPKNFFIDPRTPDMGRAFVKPNSGLMDSVDYAFYDVFRILGNIPDGSRDMIIEKSTLLECNMDRLNAISWTKGCYMGQELTARMHHRGLVKKRLFPVKVEGPAPAVGTPITLNGEDVGDMRSHSGNVGLALVNIEKAEMAINHTLSLASADSHLRIIGRPQI